MIDDYKQQIKDLLENQRIGPELRVQDFDDFMPLINGEAEDEIEKFLAGDHKLEEYANQILKYKQIMDAVPFATEHVITMEMYEMNRSELVKALEMQAECFRDKLLQKCIKTYQQLCKQ